MTNKERKKEKIKMIIKKVVDITCYIGTFLLILILVVVGVQSCSKKPSGVSAEEETQQVLRPKSIKYNDEDYYVYTYKYGSESAFRISWDDQKYLADFDEQITHAYSSQQVQIDIHCWTPGLYVLLNDGNTYDCQQMILTFKSYQQSTNVYWYRLTYVGFVYNDSSLYNRVISRRSDTFSDDYFVNNGGHISILLNKEIIDDVNYPFLDFFFELGTETSFVFNKDFNYNAPLGTTIQGLYGSATFDSSGANMRYKNYNVGYFLSNGQVFNQIQYWCIQSDSNHVILGGNDVELAPSGYWIYSFMYYRNTETNTEILVNSHDQIPFRNNDATTTYYSNSSTWTNDGFRYITFLTPLSNNLRISIDAFNNNNQNTISGYVGAGDVTDVFTLVASAFTAWLPIMSMNILPGITLGILIFIPLVATLVFAIIRIIKK